MSEFRIDQIKSQEASRGPNIAGITTFTGTSGIVMPSGDTAYRGGRGRGLFMGGYTTSPGNAAVKRVDYVTISTLGNSTNFGDLANAARWAGGSCGSSTRAFYGGGTTPTSQDHIDFVITSSTGSAMDFANLHAARGYVEACSNSIRGIWGGGRSSPGNDTDTIQYITMATNADGVDFGNLTQPRTGTANVANPTRALFCGGYITPLSAAPYNVTDYVTISTTGNAKDFGDLRVATDYSDSAGSSTRAVIGGGQAAPGSRTQSMTYFTFSSLGNGLNFGDLTTATDHVTGLDNSIRGIFGGGQAPTYVNTIEYITIATLGDATDFGDLNRTNLAYAGGTSDAHGGLG